MSRRIRGELGAGILLCCVCVCFFFLVFLLSIYYLLGRCLGKCIGRYLYSRSSIPRSPGTHTSCGMYIVSHRAFSVLESCFRPSVAAPAPSSCTVRQSRWDAPNLSYTILCGVYCSPRRRQPSDHQPSAQWLNSNGISI